MSLHCPVLTGTLHDAHGESVVRIDNGRLVVLQEERSALKALHRRAVRLPKEAPIQVAAGVCAGVAADHVVEVRDACDIGTGHCMVKTHFNGVPWWHGCGVTHDTKQVVEAFVRVCALQVAMCARTEFL